MLTAANVVKEFANGDDTVRVLNGVSVEIPPQQFVAIMGPSGSGKSTLMHILSGLDSPTDGSVELLGLDLVGASEAERSEKRLMECGFVFQKPHFLPALNIEDNVILPGFRAQKLPREQVLDYAKELFERAGISQIADRGIDEVSGGQLQRAGICRALINRPQILFGDEPTGALNSVTSAQVLELFREINAQGTTVVLVTHDPTVAAQAQRVLILTDGSIVQDLWLGDYSEAAHGQRLQQVAAAMTEHGV